MNTEIVQYNVFDAQVTLYQTNEINYLLPLNYCLSYYIVQSIVYNILIIILNRDEMLNLFVAIEHYNLKQESFVWKLFTPIVCYMDVNVSNFGTYTKVHLFKHEC